MRNINGWWVPDEDDHFKAPWDYQSDSRNSALKHVKNFNVAVDGGGHIGTWAFHLCKRFRFVHIFEPDPINRECLTANLEKYDNCKIHPFALAECNTKLKIKHVKNNTGASYISPDGEYEVEAVKLDSLGVPVLDFVKLDVQEYEEFALKGAEQTLLRCRPVVCVEETTVQNIERQRFASQKFLEDIGMHLLERNGKDYVFGW